MADSSRKLRANSCAAVRQWGVPTDQPVIDVCIANHQRLRAGARGSGLALEALR